jgi:drug/metabolite transporter (DMT)-like permease
LKKYIDGMSSNAKSIGLILATMLLFSIMDAIAKQLVQTYPPTQVIWARYASQTVATLIILSPVLHKVVKTKNIKLQLLRSTFLFSATFCFFFSLKYLQLAQVNAMFQVAPIFVTVLSVIILKEYVGPRRWVGVLVGMFGALLIIRPGSISFSPIILLPAVAALSYASYVISTKYLSNEESASTSFVYTSLIGSILASILVVPYWTTIHSTDFFIFFGFGLLGALGHFFLILAFRMTDASFLAPFTYMNLIFGTLWGFCFFNEVPNYFTISGAFVIISSGIYIWIRDNQSK